MFRFVRAAALAALCIAVAPLPLFSQSQPAPADPSAPQQVAPRPVSQAAPAGSSLPASPAALPSQPAASQPDQSATQPDQPSAVPASPPSPVTKDPADKQQKIDDHKPITPDRVHNASMWHDPGNIPAKDLYYGAGGEANLPQAPFRFLDEDKHDSNPKFDVRDASGKEWRVKLGVEARPEIVASRLLWAIGYYTEYDYVLHVATVKGLQLHRGGGFIHNRDQIIDARFARKPDGEHRIAAWAWKDNTFFGTREFNGLRVMMAVLNSWDLKDENNAVYEDKKTGQQFFLVSDTGASLGPNSTRIKNVNGKGNVGKFKDSKFITNTTATEVDFGTPAPPTTMALETAGLLTPLYIKRHGYDWIGDHIPRKDARWIGSLLGQLTRRQLVDAFRAGHFTPKETDEYVRVLEDRIAQLKAL